MFQNSLRTGFVSVLTTLLLLAIPSLGHGQVKPVKPKPVRPGQARVGRVQHSQAWNQHHQHRSLYIVRVRNLHWQHRDFATHRAARTYYRWLGFTHLDRRIRHVGGIWRVSFRSHHVRHVGTFTSHAAARQVVAAYRARGFSAWIHTRRI